MRLAPLLLDECCPASLAAALRDLGFDARYVAEDNPGISDTDVLRIAAEESRIVVTTDKDFSALVVRFGHRVTGLVLLRLSRLGTEPVARKVAARIHKNGDKLAGRVTTFGEDRIRRHPILG